MAMDPVVQDKTDLTVAVKGKVVLVNTFTAKPGQLDKFIEVQTSEYQKLLGKVEGWQGNRLIRAIDGKNAVNVAVFDNIENYNKWRNSKLFADHLKVVKPYIEKSEPGIYQILYDAGTL
jgi:antibiotic biosynthesis monooxygenase (ABM) superfamily enzyme